jgi:hypothetical protein
MAAETTTLSLDTDTWDLSLDVHGDLATATGATRLGQDAATRVCTWRGEVYYDTTQGVPYASILGGVPNLSVVQQYIRSEALKVPDVAAAIPSLTFGRDARQISGTLTVSDATSTGTAMVAL